MAVGNINSIGNVKPIPVIHFIPPIFNPVYKIELVTATKTKDITDLVISADFGGGIVSGSSSEIGSFNIKMYDPTNIYYNNISEFDTINIYLDYGPTATTKKFNGVIETISNSEDIFLMLSGRSAGMKATGVKVTYTSDGPKARSQIIKDVVEKYFDGVITTNNVEDDTGTMDVTYSEIPFWDFVADVCNSGGRDAYVDVDLDFNYFLSGSRENTTEAVVEDVNLLDVDNYSTQTESMVTSVRVYGKTDGNVRIISSSDSDTTKTNGIIKQETITNTNITTPEQGQAYANAYKATNSNSFKNGKVKSLLLPTISPGEKVNIASPLNNIPPEQYKISSYTHTINADQAPSTDIVIERDAVNLASIVKSTIKVQQESEDTGNYYEMTHSLIIDYDPDVGDRYFSKGTFSNVSLEIDNTTGRGYLHTTSGNSGTWTSPEITLDGVVAAISISHNSESIGNTKFFVSLDGGLNFVEIGSAAGNFSASNVGNTVIFKIEFASDETEVQKVGLYYTIQDI